MYLKKIVYAISHDIQQMHEFQQAQKLIHNHAYGQAHDLFLRLIQILKPHGNLPNSLLKMAFENAQKVGHKQQNDILQHNLNTLGNILQYLQNNIYYDAHHNAKLLQKYEREFIGHLLHYDFKRLDAVLIQHIQYNTCLIGSQDSEEKLYSLIEYSEQGFQKERTLLDMAILKWLHSGHGYNPAIFNANFPMQLGQVLLDHFQNAEAKAAKSQPIEFTMKLYKAATDFIISGNVHTYNKTIVGQMLNRYLKFAESKAQKQVHKPLLGLAWLTTVDQRYMSAEGLFRTIDDQLKLHLKTPEIQVLTAQYMYLNSQLLSKLTKRQTEVEQCQNYLKTFKMPPIQQKAALYFYLPDHATQF